MPLFAKPEKDNPKARYIIKSKATKSWFYSVPTTTTRVRGTAAKRATTQAIREAGGEVVSVRQLGRWFG